VIESWEVHHGNAVELLRAMPEASVDAIVTDPPYGLEFMGKEWDAPWRRGDNITADAGFHSIEMADGAARLPRPSYGGSSNPFCKNCGGSQRGRDRKGFKRCACDAPDFPNIRAIEGRAFQDWCDGWASEALRVLKPGSHLVAFGGTRMFHRLTCALEDASFEIRDCLSWLYGSGFPKSLDVSKAINKAEVGHSGRAASLAVTAPATDAARAWAGWGTALKPAWEPIVLARKPLSGTVAANVQEHGTGALNVDGCRIGTSKDVPASPPKRGGAFPSGGWDGSTAGASGLDPAVGRWPANLVLDEEAAAQLDAQAGERVSGANPARRSSDKLRGTYQPFAGQRECTPKRGEDRGGASRFFYTAKASSSERHYAGKNSHPTVKPVDLMRWLCRLVTPPGGLVLDPFTGSGSTGVAALAEGFRFLGFEREAEYVEMARRRIAGPLFAGMPLVQDPPGEA
jgi:DNA modification methylase